MQCGQKISRRQGRGRPAPLWAAALVLAAAGCRRDAAPDRARAQAPETMMPLLTDPVEIRLFYRPDPVRLDRDVLARLVLREPARITVELPPLQDRLEGLRIEGLFEDAPEPEPDGSTRRTLHLRLAPIAGETPRLAPLAVGIVDHRHTPPERRSAATRAVRFETESLPPDPTALSPGQTPVRVSDPLVVRVRRWAPLGLGALALLLLWRYLQIRRHRTPPPLSPRARALRELDALLARDLPGLARFKDYYVELTQVVRRYIERRYGIRAPEQTTPEFLEAAARHPAFPTPTLARLRDFLQAADAVKFAGQPACRATAERAAQTARAYLAADNDSGAPP